MKIKNGVICSPSLYVNDYATNINLLLFKRMEEEFNLRIIYSEKPEISLDTNFIFVFASPHDPCPDAMLNLLDLNHKPVIVSNVTDAHFFTVPRENIAAMLDRSKLIISKSNEAFRKIWPEFVDKMEFSPNFVQPYYNELQFNENPNIKCLLSGDIDPSFYTIRNYIYQHKDPQKIDWLPHTGNTRNRKHDIRNERYAQLLNSYFSCISTSGLMNYIVSKHMEIMASGSLLFVNRTDDFDLCGAIPYEDYIPIKDNIESLNTIYTTLENPDKYTYIRKCGMKFARENHSLDVTINRFRKWFDEL